MLKEVEIYNSSDKIVIFTDRSSYNGLLGIGVAFRDSYPLLSRTVGEENPVHLIELEAIR